MKNNILQMKNPVMNYAWGSHRAIAELLAEPSPSEQAQAELWMGAHPKAPSIVTHDGQPIALDRLIAQDPQGWLGAALAQKYAGRLPFLLKVLAAAQPLSIQAHPSLAQAHAGFAREEALGPARNAPTRNFRDDNHKPELLLALDSFWLMAGLRPLSQSRALAQQLGLTRLLDWMQAGAEHAAATPGADSVSPEARLWKRLLRLPAPQKEQLLVELKAQLRQKKSVAVGQDPLSYWLGQLAQLYPADVGALAPLLLQLIHLEPGQAAALKAGVLHAYLRGTGIEIMANSDNVLRGGLTPKHIDVDMLLQVLHQDCAETSILGDDDDPQHKGELLQRRVFDPGFAEFALESITMRAHPGASASAQISCGAQILFCSDGAFRLSADDERTQEINRGQSLFVGAQSRSLRLQGAGQIFRAFVPEANSR